jgi:hypothetical protein
MVKCANCGTGWTSEGLPLCPVCGTKVETPAKPPLEQPAVDRAATPAEAVRKNGSTVVLVPPEIRKVEPRVEPESPAPSPYSFPTLEPRKLTPEVTVKEKSVENEPIDASAVNLPIQALKELRVAARPLNGPLILGCLAYVAVIMLPITMAFESHKVIGILGFTLAGFFAPFAPIAWLAGLSAEKRRREQGLRPERQVTLGRLLGQWGTLLLVAQTTVALIAVAAMRLSSKFPPTFWREIL